jgi:hypothetical protein
VREFAALSLQADRRQQLANAQMGVLSRIATKAEGNIRFDGKVRKQRVILKNHADSSLLGRNTLAGPADDFAVQAYLATGDVLETGDAAQQGCLAAAGRTQQAGDAACFEREVNAIDDGLVAVALDDAI